MRTAWCIIAGVLGAAVPCGAVDLKLPDKFRPIVEMVNAAPPEFGADALERLLESGDIDDQPTRRELIERAFQLAAQAHDRWRVRALPGAGAAALMHARASEQQLDQLSLQMHAVRLMLALDKRRARDLFLEVPRTAPAPLACDDWASADLGDFYTTLGLVVDQTFTPAEKRHEDDIHLVAGYLGSIASPVQFEPARRMVQHDLTVSADRRKALLVQLGSAMAAVPADDRSFASVSAAFGADLPGELQPAFQRFVAGHANAPPCARSAAADKSWDQSDDEKRIVKDERKLMFPGNGLVSRVERATPDWEGRLDDFLSEMADWRPLPDESDSSYYHRKMFAYQGLLDVTSGSLRARLIDDMVGLALDSNLQRDAPAEWFQELKAADERVHGPDVLLGFERSGHPALVLAAALDRTLRK